MLRNIFVFVSLLLLLCACQSSPSYTTIAPATIRPGDSIPRPNGEPLLTLSGKIGVTNNGDRLDLDLETLEKIGLIEYQVDDPELGRTVTMRGVLLKNVLDVAKADPSAKELLALALNEYKSTIPLDVMRWPVMIATWRDGERIPFEDKGPIQICFPNRDYKDIDPMIYNPMWVWHLRELVVK